MKHIAIRILAAATLGLAVVAGAGASAKADGWHHGWHGYHHHHSHSSFFLGLNYYYYPPPPAYYPPPPQVVYVEPRPAPACRVFRGDATIDGSGRPFYGTACFGADGRWHIVD